MKSSVLEAGLIPVFRALIGARLALTIWGAIIASFNLRSRLLEGPHLLSALETIFLIGYLSSARLARTLGKWYLPIAILIATVAPIFENHLSNLEQLPASGAEPRQAILSLLIVLIIVAWQYDFRSVLIFCASAYGLSVALNAQIVRAGAMTWGTAIFTPLGALVVLAIIGYGVTRILKTQRELRAQIAQHALTREQLAASRERNRLARELHDTLAHTLSAIAVQLEAASAIWDAQRVEARELLERALASTRDGLTEARRAIQELRATPLDDLGLALALRQLAETAAQRGNLALELDIDEPTCAPNVAHAVYRIAQEAITNTLTHAHARRLRVALKNVDGHLRLTIQDDGCGFDVTADPGKNHFGITGMRERAQIIGGQLTIDRAPDAGTQVTLLLAAK